MEVLQLQCSCPPSHPDGRRGAQPGAAAVHSEAWGFFGWHSSSWLVFPYRLEVKEAVIARQGPRRGWAHTHPSPRSRAGSLLGLISISQPTFRFWEHVSLFRFQMHRRKLLGNSCSLNLLKTGSFFLIFVCKNFVCSSNSWVCFSPAVFSQTKLANHWRHPGVVFSVSQQALSTRRSIEGFSRVLFLLCPITQVSPEGIQPGIEMLSLPVETPRWCCPGAPGRGWFGRVALSTETFPDPGVQSVFTVHL